MVNGFNGVVNLLIHKVTLYPKVLKVLLMPADNQDNDVYTCDTYVSATHTIHRSFLSTYSSYGTHVHTCATWGFLGRDEYALIYLTFHYE